MEKLSLPVLETLIKVLSEYRGAFLEVVCGKVSQIVAANRRSEKPRQTVQIREHYWSDLEEGAARFKLLH